MKPTLLYLCLFLFLSFPGINMGQKLNKNITSTSYDTLLFNGLKWRSIGPWRGGRSLAVAGVTSQTNVYYCGAVGGGIWKTTDEGRTWMSISDSAFGSSSVGAIAVSQSNPNIIYAGMGETEMRGNISFGDGVYKSENAGKSWSHIGLRNSYAIGTLIIHPENNNIVYAACMGQVFGTNSERGLYRTLDGGKSWKNILFKNDSTGCIGVTFDPSNPNTVYATLWQACRNPYSLSSGGYGSGIYKSTNGGDSWEEISKKPGLPVGMLGKIMLCTTPAKPEVIYASIENENGGIFRSDDRGEHWYRTTDDRNLRKRPWYFSTLVADPQNADVVWCLNVQLWKSTDGGKKFVRMPDQHGDNHDMWINPTDSKKMIVGDDGGGYVSTDGGLNYSDIDLPTAQFYHVSTDNEFPYRVYGAQQDNSSICIASSTDYYSITDEDWFPVAGGEAGYIIADPLNPDVTIGGEYDGQLSIYNHKTKQYQYISVWPETNPGHGSEARKYRFNWTFPIVLSPHDNQALYVTSQFVHRSGNRGKSWEIISPDLTRHDSTTMKASGGPITKDNTGAEAYANIFSFAESPIAKGVLWAGSDDGLIHVSVDNGKNWTNVTPEILGGYALISMVEPGHYDAGVCYVAANRYKANDNKPYLLKTTDYGKTWKLIIKGINETAYCRVIREDSKHRQLLYAGTETGIYVSFDAGQNWQSLKQNLPNTPVHDIQIQKREGDLVIATHGRSFWIMDDISPLYELAEAKNKNNFLFKPRPAYRYQGGSYFDEKMQEGENGPHGLLIRYYFKQKPVKEISLKIFDNQNDTIITYSSIKDKKGEPVKIMKEFYQDSMIRRPGILNAKAGMNVFVWDLRYPDALPIDIGNNALISGSLVGPLANPGKYKIILFEGDSILSQQTFTILKDPRIDASEDDLARQFVLLKKINKKQTEISKTINSIRKITLEINNRLGSIKDTVQLKKIKLISQPLLDSLKKTEEVLTQPKAVTDYDLFNFPNKLNDKLAGLREVIGAADTNPTSQSEEVYASLTNQIDPEINKITLLFQNELPKLNKILLEEQLFKIVPDLK